MYFKTMELIGLPHYSMESMTQVRFPQTSQIYIYSTAQATRDNITECELLMSHVTKILIRIIKMRVRNKIKPEIAEEQCLFMEGKGTTNAIYTIRTIIERALEVQKRIYLCFTDYTKVFDRVPYDEIITQLTQLKIDGKMYS